MRLRTVIATLVVAAAATGGALGGAQAHTAQKGSLQIVHPWVEPAESGQTTTANPTFTNVGESAITIEKVTTAAAHEVHMLRGGKAVDRLELPAGATLAPPQVRFELHDLTVALPEGKAVPVTLHLANGESLEVHLAIGENTMNPQQMVEMPQGGHHGGEGQQDEDAHQED